MKTPTPFQDINEVLDFLVIENKEIFGGKLTGIYLTGSLSYNDFEPQRSDIDLVVVIKHPATEDEIDAIDKCYQKMGGRFKKWQDRIECSYIPQELLKNNQLPELPRPYYGNGTFYRKAAYGNEWLINNYFLYNCGITLSGPDFKQLAGEVKINELKKACIADLHKEWEPIISNPSFLDDSHRQSYVVLNLCRILHTVIAGAAVSKNIAAKWAGESFPQWRNLIDTANKWHYGEKMARHSEVTEFIKFSVEEITKTSRRI